MTTWTAPITFSALTTLTAAQMNAEVRDHLVFLKGALDLITSSTTADTGTATLLDITRASGSSQTFGARISGDTVQRLYIAASGTIQWSGGSSAADVNLFRAGVDNLATDDSLTIGGSVLLLDTSYIDLGERADPGAPGANRARLYIRDNGAGKTQLVIVFNTGAVQVIATQP